MTPTKSGSPQEGEGDVRTQATSYVVEVLRAGSGSPEFIQRHQRRCSVCRSTAHSPAHGDGLVDVESGCAGVTTGLSQRLGASNDEVGLVQWDIA